MHPAAGAPTSPVHADIPPTSGTAPPSSPSARAAASSIGGDGQVSIGQTIVKANASKVRRLAKGDVIGGFAGATADAFTLFERLEAKLEQYPAS